MLDTHLIAWLYQGERKKIPVRAQALIEKHNVAISPMVMLELEYLYEIKRIKVDARAIISELTQTIGLQQPTIAFAKAAEEALSLKWARDSFDRLICASAKAMSCKLISKDQNILENFNGAVWNEDRYS